MKNLILIVLATFTALSFTACQDRDIIDMKEFNHSLPKVENLKYTRQGDVVKLTWEIPDNISPAFKRPLEVSIQKIENDIYSDVIIVGGEGESRDIAVTSNNTYRFVVKLAGNLTDEAREKGKPDRVYSDGQIIVIE